MSEPAPTTEAPQVTKKAAPAPEPVAPAAPAPRLGDTVLYYLPSGPKKGQPRPALVTRVHADGRLNLTVFLDGTADSTHVTACGPILLERAEGAAYAAAARHEFGTWHEA